MSNEIKMTPASIRAAGKAISGISISKSPFQEADMAKADGLVSYRTKELINELNSLGSLLERIFNASEDKFDRIASEIEAADNAASKQYMK